MTTRRNFLAANLIGAAGLAANPTRMFSESDGVASVPATPNPARTDRNFWVDWPGYLTAETNQARNRRLAALASIRTKDQLQERITMVRSKLWELIGGMPEKTPLNPRVKGTLDRGSYRIENIHFESFPKVYVTANLYLPAAGKPPYPAILAPVGHSDNGKAYHYYQHLYQNLARQGYVVLSYDPFGQGERLQYINPKTGRSLYGPTGEHSQAGRPMVLMGESFALYCAWDGIRGLDYLISRPEVDATRLGCTGQSGGGTMTMYLAALEPRLRVAAVSDGNTENVAGPFFDPPGATDDAEQNIVGSLPLGIDRGDMLLAFAPKPLLICYTTHDEGVTYSPVYEEATQEIYRELQRVYGLLGAKDQVGLFASHLPHGLNFFNRIPIYAWFNRWFQNPTVETGEAELDRFPEERLNATSTGQVSTSIGGRSVVQLNTDRA
ncbi:MAG: acetylxylan esterase, partial [Acidobacteriaceae bacterium]